MPVIPNWRTFDSEAQGPTISRSVPSGSWIGADFSQIETRLASLEGQVFDVRVAQSPPEEDREEDMTTTTRTRASMTRQHFEAIAGAVRTIEGVNIRVEIVEALAPVLTSFNSSFDRDRFSRASGAGAARPEPITLNPLGQRYHLRQLPTGAWEYVSSPGVQYGGQISVNELIENSERGRYYTITPPPAPIPATPNTVPTRRQFAVGPYLADQYEYAEYGGQVRTARVNYGRFTNHMTGRSVTGFWTHVVPEGIWREGIDLEEDRHPNETSNPVPMPEEQREEAPNVILQHGGNPSISYGWSAHYVTHGPHEGRWTYNSGHLVPLTAEVRENPNIPGTWQANEYNMSEGAVNVHEFTTLRFNRRN